MNEQYPPAPGYSNQPGYPPPPRQGMGCFAKGCLTLVVLVMLLGVALGITGWYLFRNLPAFVSPTPVAIRTFPATDEQYQGVMERYRKFVQSLSAGEAATLSLSTDDLNTLIARDPEFKDGRGKIYMEIKGGEIVTETSFSLKDNKYSRNDGYFNGRVYLTASYTGGEVTLHVRRIESMDGKPMSDGLLWFINKLEIGKVMTDKINDEARRGRGWAQALANLQKVVIENDHMVATAVAGKPIKSIPVPDASPEPSAEPVASPSESP